MDVKPSLPQPIYLDSLEIDEDSLWSLSDGLSAHISLAKYFSQIRNLQFMNPFGHHKLLVCRWNIILLASQSLVTLDFPIHNFCEFCFNLVSQLLIGKLLIVHNSHIECG